MPRGAGRSPSFRREEKTRALLEKSREKPVDPNHVARLALYEADGYCFVGITFYTTTGEFAYRPGQVAVFDSALDQVFFTNF